MCEVIQTGKSQFHADRIIYNTVPYIGSLDSITKTGKVVAVGVSRKRKQKV